MPRLSLSALRWLAFALPLTSAAVVLETYYWLGTSTSAASNLWENSAAWDGGVVPPDNGAARVKFEYSTNYQITLGASHSVASLEFRQTGPTYTFYGNFITSLSISQGVTIFQDYFPTATDSFAPAHDYYDYYGTTVTFAESLPLYLTDTTTWSAPSNSRIKIAGAINSESDIIFTGGGEFIITASNIASLFSDITLKNGTLGIGADTALGSGTLFLDSSGNAKPSLVAYGADRTVSNEIVVNGLLQSDQIDSDSGRHSLTLSGTIRLLDDSSFEVYGGPLFLTGDVTESESAEGATVSVRGYSPVVFAGNSPIGFTGGLAVLDGAAIFLQAAALPVGQSTPFSVQGYGYLGLGDTAASPQSFLALFDQTETSGTIGFDTNPLNSTPNYFSGPIDLTGFQPEVRIGSATSAEIAGTITPPGNTYRFGGGGGALTVSSQLSDATNESARHVKISSGSSYDPTLVTLTNATNSFSGTVTVDGAGLIIANAGAVPTTQLFALNSDGYLGISDPSVTPAALLTHFPTNQSGGIIGFDSTSRYVNREVSGAIDLSGFTGGSQPIFLGSATWVNLSGAITPRADHNFYFAGYRGGRVNITGDLADVGGASAVYVGNTSIEATHRYNGSSSSVGLEGDNSYTGGTFLQMGELTVGHANALGTGALTVDGASVYNSQSGSYYQAVPTLRPTTALTLANAVVLNSGLEVSASHALELGGPISGTGALYKTGSDSLTLSHASTFSGGTYVSQGTLIVNANSALGTGALGFGGGESIITAIFNSTAPRIGGLYDSGTSSIVSLPAAGTTLTIAPVDDYVFAGSLTGLGAVRIEGSHTQTFTGTNTYTGGTTIGPGGTLIVTHAGALGGSIDSTPPDLTLDGGKLISRASSPLAIDLSFGTSGATLGGNGTLTFSNTLPIGPGSSISPGESIGNLTLNGPVTWASGGSYTFEFADGTSGGLIHDSLHILTANLTSTSASRFNIFIGSVDSNTLANFSTANFQSWTLLTTGTLNFTGQFNPNIFNVATDSSWSNNLNGGVFGVSLSGHNLSLTFTPVPEPSTFLLLAIGVGLVAFNTGRRRRA